jgi:hypothetical protein
MGKHVKTRTSSSVLAVSITNTAATTKETIIQANNRENDLEVI